LCWAFQPPKSFRKRFDPISLSGRFKTLITTETLKAEELMGVFVSAFFDDSNHRKVPNVQVFSLFL
jgi:hypothetical protein